MVAATLLYGTAWLRAIVPLVGNAALETSYALPSRLEHLGLPDGLALALAIAAFAGGFAWLLRESARGRARLGLAACLVLVTTAVSRRLVSGVGRPARRRRRGPAGVARLPRPLPVSSPTDHSGLDL